MSDFITEYNKVKPVLHKAFSEIGIKDGDNVISIDDVVDAVKKENDENFNLQVFLLRELIKRWSIK